MKNIVGKSLLLAVVLAGAGLNEPVDAQRGRPAPRPRPPSPRPFGETVRPQGGLFGELGAQSRESERVARELEKELGRKPSEPETAAEIDRRRDEARLRQERRRVLQTELVGVLADPMNIELVERGGVLQASLRRRDGERWLLDYGRIEAHLRSDAYGQAGEGWPTQAHAAAALTGLEAALYRYRHGKIPERSEARHVFFDAASGSVRITKDPSSSIPADFQRVLQSGNADPLILGELRAVLRASERVVLHGQRMNEDVLGAIAATGTESVRKVDGSPNTTAVQLVSAAKMGERTLAQSTPEVIDGLPTIRPGLLGVWDTWSMNLSYRDRHAWRSLRTRFRVPENVPTRPATARAVIDSLVNGGTDTLILIAHNDGRSLFLPSGETIALSQLHSLKRSVTPDRIIVLLTCRAAEANQSLDSLAESILRNGLAKSVFASEQDVDANSLPEIMSELSGSTYRATLKKHNFNQYVEE